MIQITFKAVFFQSTPANTADAITAATGSDAWFTSALMQLIAISTILITSAANKPRFKQMSKPTPQQLQALQALCGIIVETVNEVGTAGAPAGVMYAALCGRVSLDQFEQITNALVKLGKIKKRGHVFYPASSEVAVGSKYPAK